MDKSISQITLDFAAETESKREATAPAQEEERAVNVGLRLKALKQHVIQDEKKLEPAEITRPAEESTAVEKIKSTRGRKSIKQTAAEADLIQVPEDEQLFQKQYYSMAEVTDMFKVNHSLLRFWENEFDIIQPRKNKKGDRHFRPVDIKNLHLIYHLLRQRKYTIEGAKDFLKKNKKSQERFEAVRKLEQIKNFLLELKAAL
jgi:DNA-binding transcriptional MerR regulator